MMFVSVSISCSSDSLLDTICTVMGPAVIDFHGQQNSVKDRCSYSLLRIPSVPDFQVLANFQERRRKDVSFLDSVTLRLNGSGVHIHLKQGGRVLVSRLQTQSMRSSRAVIRILRYWGVQPRNLWIL
ncbi:hypothetical protein AMECASPLE_035390 [Ameca splendens]|uniref:Uncharacterized protein n=1 Tax=Ameca splendens TaxID=208324 RepID=A0ABV0YIP8_9TELE